ncbi:MAG: hypothetical protein UIH27_09325 [Ruminococcus sp.]|nr:hypothetical protein [Ruminococcus sp.]
MQKNKTDNFLKAIKGYAKHQKNLLKSEVKQLKSERLKEAEEQASRERENLVRIKLIETRNRETANLATKMQEGQKKLFIERAAMTEEIFHAASEKLIAFTQTEDYSAKLSESAKKIAEFFGGNDCVLYVSERDIDAAEKMRSMFSGSVEVKADKTVKIGGIKGYCAAMGVIADETLDSKLEAQREWFVENADLSVL